jgi:hypothetical protein
MGPFRWLAAKALAPSKSSADPIRRNLRMFWFMFFPPEVGLIVKR